MTSKLAVVICEGRSTQSTRRALEQDLVAGMAGWPGVEVAVLPHLYDLAPDGPGIQYLQSVPGDMIVLAWLYPRAAYWVLDANRVQGRMGRSSLSPEQQLDAPPADPNDDVPPRTIWCLDLRPHHEPKALLEQIERLARGSAGEAIGSMEPGRRAGDGGAARVEETTRCRWYPVIDDGRCENCLECLNFCLFGVFGLDERERLFVEQPDACRDGCPACSRVCPNGAIMFPQHGNPAIAGDPAAPADGFDSNLVQLFGAAGPQDLAAAERDRALAEKAGAEKSPKDDLDRLVDDLDQMDL